MIITDKIEIYNFMFTLGNVDYRELLKKDRFLGCKFNCVAKNKILTLLTQLNLYPHCR